GSEAPSRNEKAEWQWSSTYMEVGTRKSERGTFRRAFASTKRPSSGLRTTPLSSHPRGSLPRTDGGLACATIHHRCARLHLLPRRTAASRIPHLASRSADCSYRVLLLLDEAHSALEACRSCSAFRLPRSAFAHGS